MSKAPSAVCRYTIADADFEPRPLPPGLYLVATPIGNLSDITIRALETLASADIIYCEDTRVTSKLLARYNIAKPLKPYHDHNAAKVRPVILEFLAGGASVALVSDAGTPLISDPGYKLVTEAVARACHVEMLPGPCAPIMALVLSGLPTDRFFFAGFLPAKRGERSRFLEELKPVPATLIFFEAPGRTLETVAAIGAALGNRKIAIARELTKFHEEMLRGYPEEIMEVLKDRAVRGEVTIVVEPPETAAIEAGAIEAALLEALESLSPAKAASSVARKFKVPRREVYALALRLKSGDAPSHD